MGKLNHKPNTETSLEDKKTRVDVLLNFLQNNKFTAIVIIFGIFVIGFANVAESGNQLMRTFGLLKTYDVGQESGRGRFSSALIENAWNRIFWMRNYAQKVRLAAPKAEQEKSWEKFMNATEKWSSNLMNYYIGLDEYYPDGKKRRMLEGKIQPMLMNATEQIVSLKYALPKLDSTSVENKIKAIQDSINVINFKLYQFVDQTPPKR